MSYKPVIAVISPFLDKRHGTERCVAEQIERLADDYEIHAYSTRMEDIDTRHVIWHRIPSLPGPHLFKYMWWFTANHLWRWYDRRFRDLVPDLIYSPGINCFDADLIAVHIVFAELVRVVQEDLALIGNPVKAWPQLIHRRLYYGLARLLERRVYPDTGRPLVVVSQKVAADLARAYGRYDGLTVIYNGLEYGRFTPELRSRMRGEARCALNLVPGTFAVLLVGNDWKKKGLPCLLEAIGRLQNPALRVMVVGRDIPVPYQAQIERLKIEEQVNFLPLRGDVEFYYAAADLYAGPSLDDAFAIPPLEAMACGVPVIVSRQTGVSELITGGHDGLILEDARDARTLAGMIDALYRDSSLRERLGGNAIEAASKYTWDRNAEQLRLVLEKLLGNRGLIRQEPQPQPC
jgi:glycosyltransferase involved in cell wall biosynthesis